MMVMMMAVMMMMTMRVHVYVDIHIVFFTAVFRPSSVVHCHCSMFQKLNARTQKFTLVQNNSSRLFHCIHTFGLFIIVIALVNVVILPYYHCHPIFYCFRLVDSHHTLRATHTNSHTHTRIQTPTKQAFMHINTAAAAAATTNTNIFDFQVIRWFNKQT